MRNSRLRAIFLCVNLRNKSLSIHKKFFGIDLRNTHEDAVVEFTEGLCEINIHTYIRSNHYKHTPSRLLFPGSRRSSGL